MKALFCLSLCVLLFSCKKDPFSQFENNQLKATIYFKSGETKTIELNGMEAYMGCSNFGLQSKYIQGTSKNNAYIGISFISSCTIPKGIYNGLSCKYSPDVKAYDNREFNCDGFFTPSAGRITYSLVDGKYSEGTFEAVCTRWDRIINPLDIRDTTFVYDTATIRGSFKGISAD